MVNVMRSISCLSLVLCCLNGLCPFKSLYSIQPKENQSALESYAVPFESTSGAIYPCVPLLQNRNLKHYVPRREVWSLHHDIRTRSRVVSSSRSHMPALDPIFSRDRAHPAICSRASDHGRRYTCGACALSQGLPPRRRTSFPAHWTLHAGSGDNANRRRSLDPIWSKACRPCETRTSYTLWTDSPPAVTMLHVGRCSWFIV